MTKQKKACSTEGCERRGGTRGLCSTHYSAWWRARNPDKAARIAAATEARRLALPRKPCGWCGIVHERNSVGAGLDSEGMSHVNLLRVYGEPSASRELIVYTGKADSARQMASERSAMQAPPRAPGRWWKVIVQGACAWCGEDFSAPTTQTYQPPAYCSKLCASQYNKYKRGRFTIPASVRTSLYLRDAWVCQICMTPVDESLPSSHAWAATLDHITPQSLGGTHSPDNLRLAHRWCNSLRSDTSKWDDEAIRELAA